MIVDTKFQLQMFPFERVTALNVHIRFWYTKLMYGERSMEILKINILQNSLDMFQGCLYEC